ncbi:MAG: hypothetical protein Kow0092_29230 [Deferrisomatales bacterium]
MAFSRSRSSVRALLWALCGALLLFTAASFAVQARQARYRHRELARGVARAFFESLAASRVWNARAGGVYVPASLDVQPDPHLGAGLQSVTTRDGQTLVRVPPAYMTMLIARMLRRDEGLTVKLAALDPLNPDNAADPWEREALLSFQQGATERYAVQERGRDGGAPWFRYAAPLPVEQACLTCHGGQGHRLGEIHGEISLAFPFAPFQRAARREILHALALHGGFFATAVLITLLLGRRLMANLAALERSRARIRRLEGILPICSACKKIRVEDGDPRNPEAWVPMESYIEARSDAEFTHGLCPQCREALYPGYGGKPSPDAP